MTFSKPKSVQMAKTFPYFKSKQQMSVWHQNLGQNLYLNSNQYGSKTMIPFSTTHTSPTTHQIFLAFAHTAFISGKKGNIADLCLVDSIYNWGHCNTHFIPMSIASLFKFQVESISVGAVSLPGSTSLSPGIKMHILLTVLYTFLVELVRRICPNIKTSYPW